MAEKLYCIAIGGIVGSGKVALAYQLRDTLKLANYSVQVLTADYWRRQLAGLSLSQPVTDACFTAAHDAAVNQALLDNAATALAAGQTVIVAAPFYHFDTRQALHKLAHTHAARWQPYWLALDPAQARANLQRRAQRRASRSLLDIRQGDGGDIPLELHDAWLTQAPSSVEWPSLQADNTLIKLLATLQSDLLNAA